MPLHNLYPPGRVLWAVRNSDVSYAPPPPAEGRYSPMEALRAQREEGGVRLFEVLDVQKVFSQIVFSRDMIRYEPDASVGDTNTDVGCIRVVRTWHTLMTRSLRISSESRTHRKGEGSRHRRLLHRTRHTYRLAQRTNRSRLATCILLARILLHYLSEWMVQGKSKKKEGECVRVRLPAWYAERLHAWEPQQQQSRSNLVLNGSRGQGDVGSVNLCLVAGAVFYVLRLELLLDVIGNPTLHGDRVHATHVFIYIR